MTTEQEKIHIDVKVTGHVQGVSFRHGARDLAQALGLAGWIRNEPDGAVLAAIEGPQQKVEQFAKWCRRGPATAEVRSCQWSAGTYKNIKGFTVFHNDGSILRG